MLWHLELCHVQPFVEQGLCQRVDDRQKKFSGIDNHASCRVGPASCTAQGDGGVESRTGGISLTCCRRSSSEASTWATVGFGLRNTRLVRHACSHHGSHGACTFAPTGGCFFGNAVLLVKYQQGKGWPHSYQRSADGLFVLQTLKVERFGAAHGTGQISPNIDSPTCRGNTGIGPRTFEIVETADATLRSEHKRRQVRKFGRHQRGFCLPDALLGGKQVGVALQDLLDERL